MERVKKGEKYWYIHLGDFSPCSMWDWEDGSIYADARYEHDNYFHTKEEADDCVSKIEAVLNGADVIKTPSGKEIEERAAEKYCIRCGARTMYGCSPDKSPCTYVKDYIKIATEQRAIDLAKLKAVLSTVVLSRSKTLLSERILKVMEE